MAQTFPCEHFIEHLVCVDVPRGKQRRRSPFKQSRTACQPAGGQAAAIAPRRAGYDERESEEGHDGGARSSLARVAWPRRLLILLSPARRQRAAPPLLSALTGHAPRLWAFSALAGRAPRPRRVRRPRASSTPRSSAARRALSALAGRPPRPRSSSAPRPCSPRPYTCMIASCVCSCTC